MHTIHRAEKEVETSEGESTITSLQEVSHDQLSAETKEEPYYASIDTVKGLSNNEFSLTSYPAYKPVETH